MEIGLAARIGIRDGKIPLCTCCMLCRRMYLRGDGGREMYFFSWPAEATFCLCTRDAGGAKDTPAVPVKPRNLVRHLKRDLWLRTIPIISRAAANWVEDVGEVVVLRAVDIVHRATVRINSRGSKRNH